MPVAFADSASDDRRPVALFSATWGRFMPRVAALLQTDWRLVSSLEGVDPERVVAVVDGGPAALDVVAKLPRVRLLQQPWTGVEWLKPERVPPQTTVCNVHGMDPPIAEFVMGSMLDHAIGFSKLDAEFKSTGAFRPPFPRSDGYGGRPFHGELGGKTLGIVGLGSIGAEVARRAAAFDMRVIATTRSPRTSLPPHVSWCGAGTGAALDRLLAESDYLLLACPLNAETRGLMNAERIARMRPTAVLVNVARGACVVERDLWDALTNRGIAGAILDVWWGAHDTGDVSQQGLAWHTLPNVAMTPHASGWTYEGAEGRRIADIAANLDAMARKEALRNVVHAPRSGG